MLTTANELADEVERRADREDAFGGPGYEDFDISSALSEAEWHYVKTFMDGLNNRKGSGFEETEIRSQGLSALIVNNSATASTVQTGVHAFPRIQGEFFDLPSDFMYAIHEVVTIDKNNCSTEEPIAAKVRSVSHKEIMRFRDNHYKRPFYDGFEAEVWRQTYSREDDGYDDILTRTSKRHQIITNGEFSISDYTLSYVQLPKGLVVDRDTPANQRNSILDDSVKETLIEIAVEKLLARVKEQKVVNNTPTTSLE